MYFDDPKKRPGLEDSTSSDDSLHNVKVYVERGDGPESQQLPAVDQMVAKLKFPTPANNTGTTSRITTAAAVRTAARAAAMQDAAKHSEKPMILHGLFSAVTDYESEDLKHDKAEVVELVKADTGAYGFIDILEAGLRPVIDMFNRRESRVF